MNKILLLTVLEPQPETVTVAISGTMWLGCGSSTCLSSPDSSSKYFWV